VAEAGQTLVAQRVFSATEGLAIGRPVGEVELRGFSRPVRVFEVTGVDESRAGMRVPPTGVIRLPDGAEGLGAAGDGLM
jgi:class 3 adenylate cyclase